MASINQLVSEIAHVLRQPDSVPIRRAIKFSIIHARNELIRKSYSNHNITDKVLQQRIRLSLVDVPDGDIYDSADFVNDIVKRTTNKVPRPARLTNNLPFHSIRTAGVINPIEIAYIKEASSKCYKYLPGMQCSVSYDYNNGYIYINIDRNSNFAQLNSIIVESVFEAPHLIPTETYQTNPDAYEASDDDEFLLPEDMIGTIKNMVIDAIGKNVILDTNEVSSMNAVR